VQLAGIWAQKEALIAQIVERSERLGAELRKIRLPEVLCHADIHTANLMIDEYGELHVVDWDQPIWAPKERDLVFVLGEGSQQEGLFFDGYGTCEINQVALAYYRFEWVVQELGDYGERVFFLADLGDKTKAEAVRLFEALFSAGDVVEQAQQSWVEV
jgi:spectinomycin phosphotransferase